MRDAGDAGCQKGPWQAHVEAPDRQAGFGLLYELRPVEARAEFAAWQASHADDPVGSAAEANKRFLGEVSVAVDPERRDAFCAAKLRSQNMARLRLQSSPEDVNALSP